MITFGRQGGTQTVPRLLIYKLVKTVKAVYQHEMKRTKINGPEDDFFFGQTSILRIQVFRVKICFS